MFPPAQLNLMVRLTNQEIQKINSMGGLLHALVTKGEWLKFIGVLILSTKFQFGNRVSDGAIQIHSSTLFWQHWHDLPSV
jgi:hypothetical protein